MSTRCVASSVCTRPPPRHLPLRYVALSYPAPLAPRPPTPSPPFLQSVLPQGGYLILTNHRLMWMDGSAAPSAGRSCCLHVHAIASLTKKSPGLLSSKTKIEATVKLSSAGAATIGAKGQGRGVNHMRRGWRHGWRRSGSRALAVPAQATQASRRLAQPP